MKSSSLFYFGERSASALPSRSRHRARKNAPWNGTVFVVSERKKKNKASTKPSAAQPESADEADAPD